MECTYKFSCRSTRCHTHTRTMSHTHTSPHFIHSLSFIHFLLLCFPFLFFFCYLGNHVLTDSHMHIIISTTHNFDRACMDTLVQRNVNPIESVERTTLLLACLVHALPPTNFVYRT